MHPPNSDFALSSTGKEDITASVEQSKTEFTYADGVRIGQSVKATGTVTATGMTAGEWHGQYQFNVNLGKKAAEPTVNKQWDVSANQDGSLIMTYEASTKTARISGTGATLHSSDMNWEENQFINDNMCYGSFFLLGIPSIDKIEECMSDSEFMASHMDSNNNLLFDYPAEHLIVEEGCTAIGVGFFAASPFKDISLPDNCDILPNAFRQCANLTSVRIPHGAKVGEYAFASCPNLKTFYLPLDAYNVVDNNIRVYCLGHNSLNTNASPYVTVILQSQEQVEYFEHFSPAGSNANIIVDASQF